jgi:hypothetical protein
MQKQMRKTKAHITLSYLLLIVFISWQGIMFTHYHKPTDSCALISNKHIKRVFHLHKLETEKCLTCTVIIHKLFFPSEIQDVSFSFLTSLLTYLNQIEKPYSLLKFVKSRGPPMGIVEMIN